MSQRRSPLFAVASVVLGTVAALVLAEGYARVRDLPRIQQVDLAAAELVDGVPLWHSDPVRENPDCTDPSVVLFGSSILYGSGLSADEALGAKLEALLDGCVQNHAQPAYTFQNQRVVAERVLRDVHPEVVFFEVWRNSLNHFVIVGDTAYNFGSLAVDTEGLPNPFGLDPALGRSLFERSGLYRMLAVTRGGHSEEEDDWTAMVSGPGGAIAEQVQGRLVWLLMPRLDRPFAESVGEYPVVADTAPGEVVDIARLLVDEDVAALRADTCCHFNAAGHQVLAETLARVVASGDSPGAPPPTP